MHPSLRYLQQEQKHSNTICTIGLRSGLGRDSTTLSFSSAPTSRKPCLLSASFSFREERAPVKPDGVCEDGGTCLKPGLRAHSAMWRSPIAHTWTHGQTPAPASLQGRTRDSTQLCHLTWAHRNHWQPPKGYPVFSRHFFPGQEVLICSIWASSRRHPGSSYCDGKTATSDAISPSLPSPSLLGQPRVPL